MSKHFFKFKSLFHFNLPWKGRCSSYSSTKWVEDGVTHIQLLLGWLRGTVWNWQISRVVKRVIQDHSVVNSARTHNFLIVLTLSTQTGHQETVISKVMSQVFVLQNCKCNFKNRTQQYSTPLRTAREVSR